MRRYERLVRSEVYFSGVRKNRFAPGGKSRTVYVRIYHVPTGLTLAADNTGKGSWQKMIDYGRRHAEAYEIVLRHGKVVQTLEGRFIAFMTEKDLL